MRIAVLGGGNGSFAAAGDFALAGHDTRLWRRDKPSVAEHRVTGSKILVKDFSGKREATLSLVTNDIARLAIRTCGGQSMLKSLPLERIYRDSRCGSLMLPWTAEICLDRLGREALYEPGEKDE